MPLSKSEQEFTAVCSILTFKSYLLSNAISKRTHRPRERFKLLMKCAKKKYLKRTERGFFLIIQRSQTPPVL